MMKMMMEKIVIEDVDEDVDGEDFGE
jgi:hypothetical protein